MRRGYKPASILPFVSLIGIVALIGLAGIAALAPRLMPREGPEARQLAAGGIFVASYLALAIGRVPGLSIDRAGIALVGAALMVASGAMPLQDAYHAIDIDTLTLLLGMMIVVANLRLSGFFTLATTWVAQRAHRPLLLLIGLIGVTGIASAFLVNDAICLVLAPLVVELTLSSRRNPLPYLLAVAMASNIGSTATITGNPQNILIGSFSSLSYSAFAAALAPVAAIGLVVLTLLVVAMHLPEFRGGQALTPRISLVRINRVLLGRALGATGMLVALFFAGQPPAKAAIVIGALLLLTRRVKSWRVYAEIDWSLLLMFTGLFIIVAGAQRALLTPDVMHAATRMRLDRVPILTGVTAALSNLVSNVPAVLLLRPFVAALADPRMAWKVVAMASTLAGNFTLLGSIANLIVAEKAARRGITIGFWDYFRLGAPVTAATLVIGAAWLML
jgi:Na+/H+ antiporter NhaD/arsenite permease-like protein